ncbi:hypothetical protein G9A89_017498 [Geosiphon pyriformis]|nr:hypothetical protein G9A89_017498 [Geosiphon pyriformis]
MATAYDGCLGSTPANITDEAIYQALTARDEIIKRNTQLQQGAPTHHLSFLSRNPLHQLLLFALSKKCSAGDITDFTSKTCSWGVKIKSIRGSEVYNCRNYVAVMDRDENGVRGSSSRHCLIIF